ncbi:oxidoreductase-like domain-containing protein [Crenobacter caeni]|uniref:Oxidoreductase-like protein n=1 Tax=Crenobacter caeni TaxID=2705474 RepID=A0A6B2KQE8_9NEIS|nr:oxidoreductase-like domain-containing protein [Crenobacter caeni]NDV12127.1 oxidoreductase-like protein [Crenobacter caeni]
MTEPWSPLAAAEPPVAPEPPAEGACCGSGCEPCVWDVYQGELAEYRRALALWQAEQELLGG